MQRGKDSVLIMETIGDIIDQQRPMSDESLSGSGMINEESIDSSPSSSVHASSSIQRLDRVANNNNDSTNLIHTTVINQRHSLHQQHIQHHTISIADLELHAIKKEHGVGVELAVVVGDGDVSNEETVHTISNHITVRTTPSSDCEDELIENEEEIDNEIDEDELQHHHHLRPKTIVGHRAGNGEPITVIVQSQDDSQDGSSQQELLSPEKLSPSQSISIIDASDFRNLQPEPTYQTLTSVNGRMSPPGYSPDSSYATLTPLQPLPPISTMSDKFAYGGHSNGSTFAIMQNNGITVNLSGLSGNISPPVYNYDKMSSMELSPQPHENYSPNNMRSMHQNSPGSAHSTYSQNGLASPQKSMSPTDNYDASYTVRDVVTIARTTLQSSLSPNLSPPSGSLNSPGNTILTSFGNSSNLASINDVTIAPSHHQHHHHHPHHQSPLSLSLTHHSNTSSASLVQIAHVPIDHDSSGVSPSPPLLTIATHHPQQNNMQNVITSQHLTSNSTIIHQASKNTNGNNIVNTIVTNATANSMNSVTGADIEEINTKDLAQRISAELKRYSIPQAIFAQRVLCRSQGTLSDLLRNPKPWSKLKSGRETFRRMWKWLQEPEFQRMSALRLAGMFCLFLIFVNIVGISHSLILYIQRIIIL